MFPAARSVFVSSFSWTALLLTLTVLLQAVTLCNARAAQEAGNKYPVFPLQLSADIEITAHLIAPDSEYPPHVRRMSIHYDYMNKLARADVEEGYEAAKTYIRRYDTNHEYMVRHPPISDCKRSYLGEVMPFPDIPPSEYRGDQVVGGVLCDHYVHSEHEAVSHIYIDKSSGKPVQLTQSTLDVNAANNKQVETEVLTYKYLNVVLGAPDAAVFELESASPLLLPLLPPFTHDTCERYVGGFPYLHVFHYFVRF